jgi:hypothetical protein
MNAYTQFKNRKRAEREVLFEKVRDVLHKQGSAWDLADRTKGIGRPGSMPESITAALNTTRELLNTFPFPSTPRIEYVGSKVFKTASEDRYAAIDEGIIMLTASFRTLSGVRNEIDIPVYIKEGQVVQPSVFLSDGVIRVIAPSSIDEMVRKGTFTQKIPERAMFSPPLAGVAPQQDIKQRVRLNPGMFTTSATRKLLAAAVRGDEREFQAAAKTVWQLPDQIPCPTCGNRAQQTISLQSPNTPTYFCDICDDYVPEDKLPEEARIASLKTAGEDEEDVEEHNLPPAKGDMVFQVGDLETIGDRAFVDISWDPEIAEGFSNNGLKQAILSFVNQRSTHKEHRDWGMVADVQLEELDTDKGEAIVSFKSSEIAAPQLAPAKLEARKVAEEKPEDGALLSQVDSEHQPAERDHTDDFHVGDEVKLSEKYTVKGRGGGMVTLDASSKGVVITDKFGDGQVFTVDFDGVKADVKKDFLKKASAGVDVRKIVAEIKSLREYGYSPIDVIQVARERYGTLGEQALKQAKAKGLLQWNMEG